MRSPGGMTLVGLKKHAVKPDDQPDGGMAVRVRMKPKSVGAFSGGLLPRLAEERMTVLIQRA